MYGSPFRHGVHALLGVAAVALGLTMAGGVVSAQDPSETATSEPVSLLLRTSISPAGAPGTVTLELQGETVTLADRETATFDVTPGPIEVQLTDLPPGADLAVIRCLPYLGREVPEVADVDAGTLIVTPDAGEAVTCFFNVSASRYPVEVLVSSEPPGLVGAASLDVEAAPFPVSISEDVRRRILLPVLPAGETSTITLAGLDEGLVVDAIDCDTTQAPGASVTSDPDRRTISAAGTDFELIDCTFHVMETRFATVIATLFTDPPFTEGEVDLEMAGVTVSLGHGELATDDEADPDRYPLIVHPGPEYTLRSLECLDAAGEPASTIESDLEDAVMLDPAVGTTTCTIIISPRVATVRHSIDAGDQPVETEFTLELGADRVELLPGEVAIDADADADLYRAALIPNPGFRLDDIVCLGADGVRLNADVVFENQSVAFAPGVGATVDCSFVLSPRTGTVQATVSAKRLLPDAEFTLELGGDLAIVASGTTATDGDARTGTYHVALRPVARYRLLDIDCRNEGRERIPANLVLESQATTFALPIGATVHCEFVVQALVATVTALVDDGAAEGTNKYELDMLGAITPVASQVETADDEADASGYAVALLPYDGADLTDIDCRDAEGQRIPADVGGDNRSVSFAPGIGATIRCVFVLGEGSGQIGGGGSDATPTDPDQPPDPTAGPTERPPAGIVPRAGKWNVVNRPATIVCAGQTIKLLRTTDRGGIEVHRDGDRLIATGIGEGRGRTVLDRASDDPSVYRGSIKVAQQGASFNLEVRMNVPNPERIRGTLSGDFRAGGVRCRMSRAFTAKFASR